MKTGAVTLMVLLSLVERMLAAPVVPKNDQFVAKCRSHCSKALTSDGLQASCLRQEECLRCWASCQAFQRGHYLREYCKLNKACSSGCRQACDFYTSPRPTSSPGHPPEAVAETPEAKELLRLVQDIRREKVSSLPAGKIAHPAADKTGPENGDTDADQTGPENGDTDADSEMLERKARWWLAVDSIQPGWPLVSTTVNWKSQGEGVQYLVTWELRSGGLRGHLVSEDTHVTLSLWPDEEYVLKVFNGEDHSAPLLVFTPGPTVTDDTISFTEVSETASESQQEEPASEPSTLEQAVYINFCIGAGVMSAVLILKAYGGISCRRGRQARRKQKTRSLQPDDGEVGRLMWRRNLARLTPPGRAVAKAKRSPLFIISSKVER